MTQPSEPKKTTRSRTPKAEAITKAEVADLRTDVASLAKEVGALAVVTSGAVSTEQHDRYRRRIGWEILGLVIVLVAAIIALFFYTDHVNSSADSRTGHLIQTLQGTCQQRNDQSTRDFQTTQALKNYLGVIDTLIKQPGAIPPSGPQHDLALKQIKALRDLENSLPINPAIADCSKYQG